MNNEIDQYISNFPPEIQLLLQKVRKTIREAAPGAEETIKYQIPTYVFFGNLVHFAANKNHIGFYPAPSGLNAFKEEISKYKNSKGAVQFPSDQEIPFDLISKIVKFRAEENRNNALHKKLKKI